MAGGDGGLEAGQSQPGDEVLQVLLGRRAVALGRDDPDREGVALGKDPAVTAGQRTPVEEHPALPVLRHRRRNRDLRLQAEVHLVHLDPDMGADPARAAVRPDDRPRQDGLTVRQHHGDRTPVRHRRPVLLDPGNGRARTHRRPGLLRLRDQAGVELRAVDEPEQHVLRAARAGQLPVQREGDRVDPVLQRQPETGRQRVARRPDDAATARLVPGQFRLLQQQDAPPGHRGRMRRRGAGRTGPDHDHVPHLAGPPGHLVPRPVGGLPCCVAYVVVAAHDVLLLLIMRLLRCRGNPTARVRPALLCEDRTALRLTRHTSTTSHPRGACPCPRIRSPRPSPR